MMNTDRGRQFRERRMRLDHPRRGMQFFARKGVCSLPTLCFYERGTRKLAKRTELRLWRLLAREIARQAKMKQVPEKLEQELNAAVELTS